MDSSVVPLSLDMYTPCLSGLSSVATRRLRWPEGWMPGEKAHRLPRQLIESFVPVRDELFAHAARPEALHVSGDTGDRLCAHFLPAKEIADVVRHLHQVL
jgi:hypothetical protein